MPILRPFIPSVAFLIRAIVVRKSYNVRPHPGQLIYSVLLVRRRAACKIPNAVASISCRGISPSFISHTPSVSPSIINAPISAAASSWKSPFSAVEWRYICAKTTGLVMPFCINSCTKARCSPKRFLWLLIQITTTSGWCRRQARYSSLVAPNCNTRNLRGESMRLIKGMALCGKMGKSLSRNGRNCSSAPSTVGKEVFFINWG